MFDELLEKTMNIDDDFKDRLGHCYDLSGRYVFNHPEDNVILVHGSINGVRWTGIDKDNPHAWVEDGKNVYDPVWDKQFLKDTYYEIMDAKVTKKYTFKELCQIVAKTKYWGPWQ